MLGVCLNSAESMQQQEKAQFVQGPRSISKELRARSRELTGDEISAANELLNVLNLSPGNTEVRIIGAESIIDSLPFEPQACKTRLQCIAGAEWSTWNIKDAQTTEDIVRLNKQLFKDALLPELAEFAAAEDLQKRENGYQAILKSCFHCYEEEVFKPKPGWLWYEKQVFKPNPGWLSIMCMRNTGESKFELDFQTEIFQYLSNTDNIILKRAFITFVATRLSSDPIMGARITGFDKNEKLFMVKHGKTNEATGRYLEVVPPSVAGWQSALEMITLIPSSNSVQEQIAGVKSFVPDFHDVLSHEFGHLTDNIMSHETFAEDLTTQIMHFFVEKKHIASGVSFEDYVKDPSARARGINDIFRCIVSSYMPCLSVMTDAKLDQMLSEDIERKNCADKLKNYAKEALDVAMSGELEFCQEKYKSSVEFWQIIGLRLIKEADGKQVLYVNQFSDFYKSLQLRKPIRLSFLLSHDWFRSVLRGFQYMTDDIYKVYRALAAVHQIDFDKYLSDLKSRRKAAQSK